MSLATRVLNGRRAFSALPKLLGASSATAARAPRCTSACIATTHSSSTEDVITISVLCRPNRRSSSCSTLASGAVPPAPPRAVCALARLHGRVEVQEEEDIAGRVHLERLHHQPVEARSGGPVDAVEAIAGLVVPDGGGVRGDVVGAPPDRALAGQLGRRGPEGRGARRGPGR